MEQYEALTDVIRALSKKCEQFERYKENSEMYHRWYREAQEKNEKLQEQIEDLRNQLAERG